MDVCVYYFTMKTAWLKQIFIFIRATKIIIIIIDIRIIAPKINVIVWSVAQKKRKEKGVVLHCIVQFFGLSLILSSNF